MQIKRDIANIKLALKWKIALFFSGIAALVPVVLSGILWIVTYGIAEIGRRLYCGLRDLFKRNI